MYTNIEQRACDLAVYIIENKATVRSAAREFGISKSTVHKDLTERLPRVNPALYGQVRQLLDTKPSGTSAVGLPPVGNTAARLWSQNKPAGAKAPAEVQNLFKETGRPIAVPFLYLIHH